MKHLIPKPGLRVLTPAGQDMPPEGIMVELSTYWRRRLREGAVTEAPEPAREPEEMTDGD